MHLKVTQAVHPTTVTHMRLHTAYTSGELQGLRMAVHSPLLMSQWSTVKSGIFIAQAFVIFICCLSHEQHDSGSFSIFRPLNVPLVFGRRLSCYNYCRRPKIFTYSHLKKVRGIEIIKDIPNNIYVSRIIHILLMTNEKDRKIRT